MDENKMVPQLRFKGFSDDWEQCKLDELAVFGGGHTPSMADESNYIDGKILWVTSQDVKMDYLSDTTTKLSEKGASELKMYPVGTLLMVTRSGILRHTLPVSMLRKPSTVNQDIRTINTNESCSSFWLMQHLKAHSKELLLEYGKTGTTVESIEFAKMKSMALMVPEPSEQKAIGELFYQLDNLITLHQRKYDKLLALKKSMLEKMFPKAGSNVPEIRFAGFYDPWEQRKLNEFVSFFSGLTYSPADIRPAGTLVLRSSNVKDGEVVDADNVYVDPAVVNSENVQDGDIIVVVRNGSRALIGKHAEIKGFRPNTVIGAFMTGIRSEHPSFLNALLNTPHFDNEVEMNMGATINQITGYMFSKMEFMVPSSDEQDAIGEYFKELDTLITLHQRKCETLKNIKQSLLQKMYV